MLGNETMPLIAKPAPTREESHLFRSPDQDEIDDAQEKHEAVFGFRASDFHRGNMGYRGDTLVFIDFGRHGYEYAEEEGWTANSHQKRS
jgi:hypothetical protein